MGVICLLEAVKSGKNYGKFVCFAILFMAAVFVFAWLNDFKMSVAIFAYALGAIATALVLVFRDPA